MKPRPTLQQHETDVVDAVRTSYSRNFRKWLDAKEGRKKNIIFTTCTILGLATFFGAPQIAVNALERHQAKASYEFLARVYPHIRVISSRH
jgi:hypothetical protein